MDKIYEQAMLFDFYGELLTEHQRSVYQDAVCHDLSLGEIAEERGISRQGVHDLIRRCDKILQGYESKLHLVERFARAKETLRKIERLTFTEGETDAAEGTAQGAFHNAVVQDAAGPRERLHTIRRLSRELLEEL